jgi:hypothetical protein
VPREENVKQLISSYMPKIVCLQKTKMDSISPTIVRNTLGAKFDSNFVYLPSIGISGGTLLAATQRNFQLQNHSFTNHTISASIHDLRNNSTGMITGVYGPQGDLEKRCLLVSSNS